MSSKLQDTLVMIEEQLDVALSNMCQHFNEQQYASIQSAYEMLNKVQTAMDQLHMHFANTIHHKVFAVVLHHAREGAGSENLQKKQYSELCSMVSPQHFLPCLIDLANALWSIMRCYRLVSDWHSQRFVEHGNRAPVLASSPLPHASEAEQNGGTATTIDADDDDDDMAASVYSVATYVGQKLEQGPGKLWADMEQKVKTLLSSIDLVEQNFGYDQHLQVKTLFLMC